ncbi:MAG: hypothetical protein JSV65_03305 [Armatimonadota bacterium]|nr:MAG: hypothetical protein JSV65_03305 [Armatimonadota bacterium]
MGTTPSIDWAVRVIPLPHEMSITDSAVVRADELCALGPAATSPPIATALDTLRSFALGREVPPCRIRLALSSQNDLALPAGLAERLRGLPNADQAYALLGRRTSDGAVEILLVANTPQGLLFAARTLEQLVSPPSCVTKDTELILPLGEIVDWPDIPERGQWGEDPEDDLAWMSRWKFNVVEMDVHERLDERGQPIIRFDEAKVAEGAKLGIRVVPFLGHLEHLARGGLKGWEDCYSVPTEERAKRSDFHPTLCMSKPRTRELIAGWIKQIAAVPGVRDISVWLSEEETPCCCEQCRGHNPYSLEVAVVLAAFREAQAEVNPDARLRILTSQGSYASNDEIVAALPADIGLTYYHGSRTYDSTHDPMIYPLLEKYAASGRWLGVYPQITNAWGTVLPWTGPQFIQARMDEFYGKRLASVIRYAVPSHRFHEFNCTAAAEWSWNHAGRTPREFARAFARAAGIADVEPFAEWAEKIGPVGWDVAATKIFLCLMYDPSMGLREAVPLDHRFEGGPEVLSEEQIERDLSQARDALALARRMNTPDAVDETEMDIAALKFLRALYRLSHVPLDASQLSAADIRAAADNLDTLDRSAAVTSTRLRRWGERESARIGESLPGRLANSIHVVPRAASVVRGMIGDRLGIDDPHPESHTRELGSWSGADFADGPERTLTFDATEHIAEPGRYAVCLSFIESAYGTDVRRVRIVALDGETRRQVLDTSDPTGGVSMWSRYSDMSVRVPEILPGCRYVVEIDVRGIPADAPPDRRTCSGSAGIRREWPENAVAASFFAE